MKTKQEVATTHDPDNDIKYVSAPGYEVIHEYSMTGMHRIRVGPLVGSWTPYEFPAFSLKHGYMALTDYFEEALYQISKMKKMK